MTGKTGFIAYIRPQGLVFWLSGKIDRCLSSVGAALIDDLLRPLAVAVRDPAEKRISPTAAAGSWRGLGTYQRKGSVYDSAVSAEAICHATSFIVNLRCPNTLHLQV